MLDRAAAGVEVAGVFEKTPGGQRILGVRPVPRPPACPVYLDANPRNMHHKVIVIDGEIVVVGSFNFSENADKSNDENVLIIYNRAVAAKFEEEYQRVLKAAR